MTSRSESAERDVNASHSPGAVSPTAAMCPTGRFHPCRASFVPAIARHAQHPRGHGVLECLANFAILLEPLTGADVGLSNFFFAVFLAQPLTQQVAEKVVVAIPFPFIVKQDDKQIGAFQLV